MCTGKRWGHIRNAPLSRTAVTGIGPYTSGVCFMLHSKNRTCLTNTPPETDIVSGGVRGHCGKSTKTCRVSFS